MRIKASTRIAAVLLTAFVAASGFFLPEKAYCATKIKSVNFSNVGYRYTIKEGQKKRIKVSYYPSKASRKKVKWISSKPSVVYVTSRGTIKARKKGTATITAVAKDGSRKRDSVKVTVGTKVRSVKWKNASSSKTMYIGRSFNFNSKCYPSNASNKHVKYTTSNKKIATVTSRGVVKGKKNGTATIKAYATDGTWKSVSCKIKVKTLMKSIKMNSSNIYDLADNGGIDPAGKTKLKYTVSPSSASSKSVSWTSSDASVATVSSSGTVTAVSAGTVKITAKAKDGSGVKTSKTVTVYDLYKGQGTIFIGHRGYDNMAPENTVPSFEKALEYKFDASETDIWENTEGELMILHDDNLQKMCSEDVSIKNVTTENRADYPLTAGTNIAQYHGLTIPTADEYLDAIGSTPAVIEIKDTDISDAAIDTLIGKLSARNDGSIISSFYISVLSKVNERETALEKNNVDTMLLMSDSSKSTGQGINSVTDGINYCLDSQSSGKNGIDIIAPRYDLLSADDVAAAHRDDLKVAVWTVDDAGTANTMMNWHVDYITSNNKLFHN